MRWPTLPEWLLDLMLLSAVAGLLVWGVTEIVVRWRRKRSSFKKSAAEVVSAKPEFISLKEAAISLYEKSLTGTKLLAMAAERLSGQNHQPGSPNDRIDFIATHISKHISVYGKKEPSRVLARIDDAEMQKALFCEGGTVLRDIWYDKSIFWTDLAVKSTEFDSKLEQLLWSND